MRLLFDTNIVLDVFLARDPWLTEAQALWRAHDQGRVMGYLPASALTDIFYIIRRHADLDRAQRAVVLCLETFEIGPVTRATLDEAVALPGSDFEDNVVVAMAQQLGLDGIVTRDPAGFHDAPVRVFSPQEALVAVDASS